MGFFSNIFFGAASRRLVDPAVPIETVLVEKSWKKNKGKDSESGGKEKRRRKRDVNKQKRDGKRKGWGMNKKKKQKSRDAPTPAPKLSLFLQQSSDGDDDNSFNNSIGTRSLTASLSASLSASLNSSPSLKFGEDARSDSYSPFVRPLTPQPDTRPTSVSGITPPPLHESFPISGVSEDSYSDSGSDQETMQDLLSIEASPLHEIYHADESDESGSTSETSDGDHSPTSSDGTDPATSAEISDVSSQSENVETFSQKAELLAPSLDFRLGDRFIDETPSLVDSEEAANGVDCDNVDEDSVDDDLLFLDAELLFLDIEKDATEDHLSPNEKGSDYSNGEVEPAFFSAVDIECAIQEEIFVTDSFESVRTSEDESQIHMEFDLNFLKHYEKSIHKDLTKLENNEAGIVAEGLDIKIQKRLSGINVDEVKVTFDTSQNDNGSGGKWIPNGLLANLQDDSSLGQQSSISFTSDEFKEDDNENELIVKHASKPFVQISTIMEEKEDEGLDDLNVTQMEHDILKSVESDIDYQTTNEQTIPQKAPTELEDTVSSTLDENFEYDNECLAIKEEETFGQAVSSIVDPDLVSLDMNAPSRNLISPVIKKAAAPKSALLSRRLSKPQLKKSVSWKDETDVITYLSRPAQDLQKARDLVAAYGKIMEALNLRRPCTEVVNNIDETSSSSDADISEASSESAQSLLSVISTTSSSSQESVKIALEQIAQETTKLDAQGKPKPSVFDDGNQIWHEAASNEFVEVVTEHSTETATQSDNEEVMEIARSLILDNKWPDNAETNNSSSSIESLLSAFSHASNCSTESLKKVVLKLKEEAEKIILLSPQHLEEKRTQISNMKLEESNDSIVSSSSYLTAPSNASSTGTSESVKLLMAKLTNERSRQAQVFSSTRDMFSLFHDNHQQDEARAQIILNNCVNGDDCESSSSSISSLISASPFSSGSTTESSESVIRMMRTLKNERARHQQRRNRIRSLREFVDSIRCTLATEQIVLEQR